MREEVLDILSGPEELAPALVPVMAVVAMVAVEVLPSKALAAVAAIVELAGMVGLPLTIVPSQPAKCMVTT